MIEQNKRRRFSRPRFSRARLSVIIASALVVCAGLIEGSFSQLSARSVPYPAKIGVAVVLFAAMSFWLFGRGERR